MRSIACLLLAAASVAAQPTIRVTTRLVDVNVIATDGKAPVTGLGQSDFTVLDNGVAREIAFFSVQSVRAATAPAARPNVFTNRADARQDAPERLSVFVLDALNTDFAAQARVRQQLLKYLDEVGPRDRVAIWVMTDRLRRIQDFTNDRKALTAAVTKVTPSIWLVPTAKNGAGQRDTGAASAIDTIAEQKSEEMQQYWRMQVTNELMKDLGSSLAQIPGRKNVIWLSRAFPLTMTIGSGKPDHSYVADRLNGTGRALAKANVAVYPVDASGLAAAPGGTSIAALSASEQDRHHALDLLAADTGGRAFYDTNDLAGAVRSAVADTEVTYTIGFYPGEEDGNYHRLQISVKRPGVTLRYRPGYLAPDATAPEERDEIRNALWSPVEAAGIAVEVRIEKRDPKRPGWLPMTVAIASQNLGTCDLIVTQHAADGHELITVREAVAPDQKKPGPMILPRQVELRKGATTLRVVVFDHDSGRIGSVEFPVQTEP
jgi:VWFA-related protein